MALSLPKPPEQPEAVKQTIRDNKSSVANRIFFIADPPAEWGKRIGTVRKIISSVR
jgi:hypothetical protein